MELKGFKKTIRWKKRKVIPPKVKVTDAKNGRISIDAKNATVGKYQVEVIDNDHTPITLNIEVI